ncbi:SEFIR domain-containing protein [Yersinia ruckeri]|uniref:SEFIR domain-containing protein n=1 Tax=Yersinia ruckeri TaxID=29486 RepID=UPI002237286A|nr:SEFIR domain-containing protein [Yersinia ruckeri]MCW6542997.1 TIR domain-containing protein [Yersinia ruckeri]MCW6591421.1 TIR domain-containing protein [Yersinia ruckeri]UZX90871.1 TIR domain-containing protein [Yersinia ruckeri]
MESIEKQPKVFISYCWNGQSRQDQIVELVQRLAADGVDSIVDIYDLKEGDDKYHFMEKMVTDNTVSHVLVICDEKYSVKANERRAGVGTESQIISQEIYSQVSQSKFIPLIYEFDSDNEAYTPTFFKSRIYMDFSSPERENENWERLIRLLHGKPELKKPQIGKRPAYLDIKETNNTYGMDSKFKTLKNALFSEKSVISIYRDDFLDSCFKFIDSLRVRENPKENDRPQQVINDFKQLTMARNLLIDWCLIEAKFNKNDFPDSLLIVLEKLLELSSRPSELDSWQDNFFLAHKAFSYECFLYFIAALIKSENYSVANDIFTSHYKLPDTSSYNNTQFCQFEEFYYHSDYLQEKLSPPGRKLHSTIAELLKIHANRDDLKFIDIMQADLIIKMFNFTKLNGFWYPHTLNYSSFTQKFPFFIRAEQHKNFSKLLVLTGMSSKDDLKEKIMEGIKLEDNRSWRGGFRDASYPDMFNMDNWDTIK